MTWHSTWQVKTQRGATLNCLVISFTFHDTSEHPAFAKVAFTGSTPVGKALRRSLAGTGRKISLELGGKSPVVVFDTADLDSAVEGLVNGIWFNQGQVCCAASRLLVQESVADRFVAKLKDRMATLRLGHSLDKAIDMGAVADEVQVC